MRIGITTAHCHQLSRAAAVRTIAAAAEQVGYQSVWALDGGRPSPGACPETSADVLLDPLGVLTATAAVTSRVRLGAAVLVEPGQRPAPLCRSLRTLDVLSEGRLVISLTGGGSRAGRAGLEALLDAVDRFWGTGSREGERARRRPRPPVLLAVADDDELALVARRADGWNPSGLPVAVLGPMWARVRGLAASEGRDPDSLQLVVGTDIALHDRPLGDDRPSFHGSAEQVADDIDAARAAGAHEVVLNLRGNPGLDEALDGYARVAEAASLRAA